MEIILSIAKHQQTTTISEYRSILAEEHNIQVSNSYVCRVFQELKWSWKKPAHIQIQKFKYENIERYLTFYDWIIDADLTTVHFLDEAHFVSR